MIRVLRRWLNFRAQSELATAIRGVAGLCLWAAFAGPAWSHDDTRLSLRLEAPPALSRLIETHLPEFSPGSAVAPEGDRDALLRRLRHDIAELAATEGYFSPTVDGRSSSGEFGELIVISVAPGPRSRVMAVEIEFRGAIQQDVPRMVALRQAWSLPQGAPFRQDDWDSAKRGLQAKLSAEDFAAGRIIDSSAQIDPVAASARLSVVVDSGPRFYLGKVEISGLERYSAALVERYSTLHEGEAYHQDSLLGLQAVLQNTPYFSSAVVELDADAQQADAAPVRIQLREAQTRRIGLSAGYSTNTGYRGELVYRNHDFLKRAWDLSTGLRLEQRRSFYFADVLLPPTTKDYRDSFGLLAERSDIQGLGITRYGAGAVRSRQRENIETRLALNLQRERRSVGAVDGAFNNTLSLSWGWTYRDVDNPLNPRDGYNWMMEFGGGSKLLLSDQNFARAYTRLQRYFPVGREDALMLRGEFGAVLARSRQGVPESFLFRAGGAQSIRGFAYQSLGAREAGAVVGARALAVVSAEYLHWWGGEWGTAVFVDAGDAADSRAALRLNSGYGAGLRWKSPVGPLALDLAYGHQARQLRLHFSVAIGF